MPKFSGSVRASPSDRYQSWGIGAAFIALWMLISGCAPPVKQLKLSQPMSPMSGKTFTLEQDVKCTIGTGYERVLRKGTRWELVGAIDRGEIYSSLDQTLTVEGANIHEAYIVTKDESLVGFFLVVEKTFTPVAESKKLKLITK